jgi:hypothetical protein
MHALKPTTPHQKQESDDPKPAPRRIGARVRAFALIGAITVATSTASFISAARASDSDPQTVALLTSILRELVAIRQAVQASPPAEAWD